MKLSRNWLKRYLDVPYSDEELADMLTTIGLEVEGVESVESIKGGLEGVVVGLIKSCEPHPDADKLSVTKVNVGGDDDLDIVCGAPNVGEGQKVLVATVGTTLYTDEGSFKIKKAKIRGSVSEGMICAEDELGLGESHYGIMILDEGTAIGTPAAELFDLETDTVFDIGLTPNRSDATSQFGVAKDLTAYIKINKGDDILLKEPNHGDFHINNTAERFDIEIENQIACPRYSGLVINNIQVGPSPDWMQKLLKSIGVKPINNVVDVTNFILHELGQPLHAFDANKINDGKIIVKNLKEGTEFVGLDDRKFKLKSDDLMICDGDGKGMCIAGVFGGKNSGVTESTTKLFLESAYFNAGSIRKTSMHHNLRTDAAKIYEKGADPNITILALKRAAMMIAEFTGGVISSEIIDIYPKKISSENIRVRYQKVNEVIGHELEEDTIHSILNALGMEISPVDEESIKVKVPTNKFDVTREIDIIEEILRIYGFNEVPIPSQVKSNINYSEHPNKSEIKNLISDHLASNGFNEMMGLSLMESKQCTDLLSVKLEDLVLINNTSNIHLDSLRPDMMISGIVSILHNLNRQQSDVKLFEFGKTYLNTDGAYQESEYFTVFMSGNDEISSWNQIESKVDYYSIKQRVEMVLNFLGISKFQRRKLEDDRFYYGLEYHRGNQSIVKFGEVSPRLLKKINVKQSLFYAEFEFKNLISAISNKGVSVSDISKFPSVKRDLALVLDKKVSFDEVEMIARKTIKQKLSDISLFDVFESEEHLGQGKKSYAISLTFESFEKTLEDKEIETLMNSLIKNYEKKLNALIRK